MKAKVMKKWSALSMAVMLSMALMTACGSSESESTTGNSGSQTTLNGFVTAISGNEITLSVMQDDKGAGSSEKGSKPDGTPPADVSNGQKDDSDQPSGNPGASGGAIGERPASGGGMNANAETKTITITDDTKISVQNGGSTTEGSTSDIALDSRITVTMDGDTVSAITVQTMNNPNGEAPEQDGGTQN